MRSSIVWTLTSLQAPDDCRALSEFDPADAGGWINDAGVGAALRVTDFTQCGRSGPVAVRSLYPRLVGPTSGGTRQREDR